MLVCIIQTKPHHWKKKRGVASRKGTENEWNRTLDSLLTLAADIDLFCSFRAVMLLCQQVSVLKEELWISCFLSAGSEQLQPRGCRRLQAAGSQCALGGRGFHYHRPHPHWHLLRGSIHKGEQMLSQPSVQGLPNKTLRIDTTTSFYLFRDVCMLSKRIFSYFTVLKILLSVVKHKRPC